MSLNASRFTRSHKHVVNTGSYAPEPLFTAQEVADNLSAAIEAAKPAVLPRRYANDVIAVNCFGQVTRKSSVLGFAFTIRHGVACRVFSVWPSAAALQVAADNATSLSV